MNLPKKKKNSFVPRQRIKEKLTKIYLYEVNDVNSKYGNFSNKQSVRLLK